MNASTWWALGATIILIFSGGLVFWRRVILGDVKQLKDFQRWTRWAAVAAALLIIISAIPFVTILPQYEGFKDIAAFANAFGPLALMVSATLAAIFYSVGDWYEAAQKFRQLGLKEARPDRAGRQADRAVHWQNVLGSTQNRMVITGVTLGGWFVAGWEDTHANLLAVLPRATVQVLLADPNSPGFRVRADDPGEQNEAARSDRAPERARKVYEQIALILQDPAFQPHLNEGKLCFYVYPMTPISVVWVDDTIYFTSYLPYVSDKACPEFTITCTGLMGLAIANAIEGLIRNSTKITTVEMARHLAAACR